MKHGLFIILLLAFAQCQTDSEFTLTIKNSSYSVDSLKVIVKIDNKVVLRTIVDNDSIDHSHNSYNFPLTKGEHNIELYFPNAVGKNHIIRDINYPMDKQLNVIYYYYRIYNEEKQSYREYDSPRFQVFFGEIQY
ncbi:hypothetical protein OO013_13690 [Mangrovivirga sp. M17]|uniref:Uncharacterized protein n=1 Tax=Mangrovivirga halotolerans TaxID=2993936 RepID=A0ABT3RTH7_9BACT|nr:hypothetical protein [Mangrovivirga halotolerans]MCX2744930.1 hypothetical protein [Mangrovivirga halotolerans]